MPYSLVDDHKAIKRRMLEMNGKEIPDELLTEDELRQKQWREYLKQNPHAGYFYGGPF